MTTNDGSGSGSDAWVWIVLAAIALYWTTITAPEEGQQREPASIAEHHGRAHRASLQPSPPSENPDAAAAGALASAKRTLLLTHTGRFRSRDLHAEVLALLAKIPDASPDAAEAKRLRAGIIAAYKRRGLAAPKPKVRNDAVAAFTARGASAHSSGVATPKVSGYGACAENGSCYGDVSPITGRAKRIHVRGYYRGDGTYVRGHYRSK